jgi:bacterioferritin
MNKKNVIKLLNDILEHELAGVVRYTHYSLMIFGHNRIPIVGWFRGQATDSLDHASKVGEWVTTLGGHPSLKIGKLLETHKHKMNDILKESLSHEKAASKKFYELLKEVEGEMVGLEEFTRESIAEEEMHISEVEKMMQSPK